MKVQVALTTKNEEESIQYMIREIRKIGIDDIFVVDEQSIDRTSELANEEGVPVYQRDGLGKGYGVKKAIEIANSQGCDILVLPDCDCTYPPREIPRLLKHFPKYDMVVGKRNFKQIAFLHRIVNYVHTWAVNLLYKVRLGDINSGMRAVKVSKFRNLLEGCGFDIEAQMTVRALKKGLKIKEVPIDYERRRGESKIRVYDAFVILNRIIKEKKYNIKDPRVSKIKEVLTLKPKNNSFLVWIIVLWVTTVFGLYIFYNLPRMIVVLNKIKGIF